VKRIDGAELAVLAELLVGRPLRWGMGGAGGCVRRGEGPRGLGEVMVLAFERLTVFQDAVAVARGLAGARWPRGHEALRDQAVRAAQSVVLNLAEGCGSQGGNRKRHFRLAQGSACEVIAALYLVDLPTAEAHQKTLRRVHQQLRSLR